MNTRERVGGLQLLSVMACFLFGTILRTGYITSILANDSWISAFSGALLYLPEMAVLLALSKRYPEKTLFAINDEVFGAVIGRALSVVYLYFFITVCSVNVLDLASFTVIYLLPRTPLTAVVAMFMITCCYAVRKGIEPLIRISTLLALGSFLVLVINSLLSLSNVNLDYLFPMFNRPLVDYVQGSHVAASLYFGESIIFLMFLPLLGRHGNFKGPLIANFLLSMLVVLLVQLREVLTLGLLLPHVTQPSFETIRMINIDNLVTRIESVYAFVMITLTFFKVCVIFYASAIGLSHITRTKSHRPLVLLLGALVGFYALRGYYSTGATMHWVPSVSPFIFTVVELLLPLLTLLAGWIKGLPRAPWNRLPKKAVS